MYCVGLHTIISEVQWRTAQDIGNPAGHDKANTSRHDTPPARLPNDLQLTQTVAVTNHTISEIIAGAYWIRTVASAQNFVSY